MATLLGMGTVCVIENSPAWHLGRLKGWLADAGLEPQIIRPHAGEDIPAEVGTADALVALGGGRGAEWGGELTALLRRAVAENTPTLAFCSSARALATAFGGQTAPVETFNPGPRLIGRRDAADKDPLFATAPMALDVVSWRHEELSVLPPEAVLLAATPQGGAEVFRIGDCAWGIQSHVELDGEMVRGLDGGDALAERVESIGEYLTGTWQPVVARFAGLATGRTAGTPLPLLES